MRLETATTIAQRLVDKLAPHCIKCEIAGSIRRGKSEVKDIEIVCIPKLKGQSKIRIAAWISTVFSFAKNDIHRIMKGKLGQGKYLQIRLEEGIKLDLFMANTDNWGYIYMLRTGSKDFSKRMVNRLKDYGYRAKGGLIFRKEQDDIFAVNTERDFFDLVYLQHIPPKDRH